MLYYAHCKINLGLQVLAKRADGYHDIATVMYPVKGLYDMVEIVKNDREICRFSASGIPIDCYDQDNICVKAYRLMQQQYGIGGADIHLHKCVPFGAGLGGGSSDGVAVLKLLNQLYQLHLPQIELQQLASLLGSDTVFFVGDIPMLCSGRGEITNPVSVNLSGYMLWIVKPMLHINTAGAYRNITPNAQRPSIVETIGKEVSWWKENLENDFEKNIPFDLVTTVKQTLYNNGALYASMSGSGSAFYGIFPGQIKINPAIVFPDYFTYSQII